MNDLITKKCLKCKKAASFGLLEGKLQYCSEHQQEDMVNLRDKKCKECDKYSSYGLSAAKREYYGNIKNKEW